MLNEDLLAGISALVDDNEVDGTSACSANNPKQLCQLMNLAINAGPLDRSAALMRMLLQEASKRSNLRR